jgi:hypothetical protein
LGVIYVTAEVVTPTCLVAIISLCIVMLVHKVFAFFASCGAAPAFAGFLRGCIGSPSHRRCIAIASPSQCSHLRSAGDKPTSLESVPHIECGVDHDRTDWNESNFGLMHTNATICQATVKVVTH